MNTTSIRALILVLLTFTGQLANAQDEIIELVTTVEQPPIPNGGYDTLYKWIDDNITWQQGRMTTVGKVWIETLIDTTGTLTEIKIIKGLTDETNKEALRLAQLMPPWIPAEQRGKKVKYRAVFFVRFGEL